MKLAPAAMKDAAAKTSGGADSVDVEPFHAVMQGLSEADEKPKTKPAKRDGANDSAMAGASSATPASESKPPLVWRLPQISVPVDVTPAPGAAMASKSEEKDQGDVTGKSAAGVEPIHAATQGSSEIDEKPRTKPAKTDAANGLAMTAARSATSPSESKTPVVWRLPHTSAPVNVMPTPSMTAPLKSENQDRGGALTGKNAGEHQQVGRARVLTAGIAARPARPPKAAEAGPANAIPVMNNALVAHAPSVTHAAPIADAVPVAKPPDAMNATPVTTAAPVASPSDAMNAADLVNATPPAKKTETPGSAPAARATQTDSALPTRGTDAESFALTAEPDDSSSDPAIAAAAPSVASAPSVDAANAKVAFEARLRPILPAPLIAVRSDGAPRSIKQGSSPETPQSGAGSTAPRPAASAASSGKHNDSEREPQERPAKSASAPIASQTATAAAAAAHAETAAPASAAPAASTNPMAAPIAVHTPVTHSAPAAPPSDAPSVAAEPALAADPAPAPAAATDIKIALNDNGQRVELRVTERAGDIHVAVRTPDSQLATALRDDLPALSTKLEQSGFHSDMWRPPASLSTGDARTVETASSGNAASDSHEHPGGKQQQENPQENPRNQQQTLNRKSDRKEFSWLFDTIR